MSRLSETEREVIRLKAKQSGADAVILYVERLLESSDELRERVISLFNRGGGWIPGAAYRELAEVLGVSTDRLVHYNPDTGHHYPEGTEPA